MLDRNIFLAFASAEEICDDNAFLSLCRSLVFKHWDIELRRHSKIRPGTVEWDECSELRAMLGVANLRLNLWRCPDLFYWIRKLLRATSKKEYKFALHHLLFCVDGAHPRERSSEWLRGREDVFRWSPQGWVRSTDRVARRLDEFRVYYPVGGLFSDLFEGASIGDGYPATIPPADKADLDGRLLRAISIVDDYSREFGQLLRQVVSTIGLLPDARTYSCNFGLLYPSAVFLNLHIESPVVWAASLMHECLHLCNWVLWSFNFPEGMPEPHVLATSPMTGNEVEAFSLCDAMMIYASNTDLYGWASSAPSLDSDDRRVAARKHKYLASRMPELYSRVAATVAPNTRFRRYLDFSYDFYQQSLKVNPDV